MNKDEYELVRSYFLGQVTDNSTADKVKKIVEVAGFKEVSLRDNIFEYLHSRGKHEK